MQKTIFLSLVAGWVTAVYGQSTGIDELRNGLRAGDVLDKQAVYRDPGPAGEDCTWDFSSLPAQGKACTVVYGATSDSLLSREEQGTVRYYQSYIVV